MENLFKIEYWLLSIGVFAFPWEDYVNKNEK